MAYNSDSVSVDSGAYIDRSCHLEAIHNPCFFCGDTAVKKLSIAIENQRRRPRSIMLCEKCIAALKVK